MKIKSASCILFLFSSVLFAFAQAPATQSQPTSMEVYYFRSRDAFVSLVRQAKGKAAEEQDNKALANLETQLKAIIGPVKIEGFDEKGQLNIETLQDDTGADQVDGLKFGTSETYLFVTTSNILRNYLSRHSEYPANLTELSKDNEFYHHVFDWDAAVTYYGDVPVKHAPETFARAFLGLTAQDYGNYPPNTLFVFVSKGDRIRIASVPIKTEVSNIPRCITEWQKFKDKATKAAETKDEKADGDSDRLEEEGFAAYHECFGREAKNWKFFPKVIQQAQSIENLLDQ